MAAYFQTEVFLGGSPGYEGANERGVRDGKNEVPGILCGHDDGGTVGKKECKRLKRQHEALQWLYDKYHKMLAHASAQEYHLVRRLEEDALQKLTAFEAEHFKSKGA